MRSSGTSTGWRITAASSSRRPSATNWTAAVVRNSAGPCGIPTRNRGDRRARDSRSGPRFARGRCRSTRRQQRRPAGSVGSRQGLGGRPGVKIGRGAVVVVALDPRMGREQHGVRPVRRSQRSGGHWRPAFSAGMRGAGDRNSGRGATVPASGAWPERPRQEVLCADRPLRSIDKRRIRRVFGSLAPDEIAAIDEGLASFLGLGDRIDE